MDEIEISPALVGRQVRNAARPEWGVGRVRSVAATTVNGQSVHRVVVDFPVSGAKTMMIPPARLADPQPPRERQAGWIDGLAGRSLDDALWRLPEHVTDVLASPRGRLAAALTLYRYDADDPRSLLRWAMDQTGSPDPLGQWSRDELATQFQRFAGERDAHLRNVAAQVRMKEGPETLRAALDELERAAATRARAALARII